MRITTIFKQTIVCRTPCGFFYGVPGMFSSSGESILSSLIVAKD
jgi:hypothetical protein